MESLLKILAFIAAIGLIFFAGVLGFWVADREYPTHVITAFLVDHEVPQGGQLQTHRTVERTKLCHTVIDRYLIDVNGVRWDIGTAVYPNGAGKEGREEFVGVQHVPDDIPPGQASYYAIVCYRCNPIQWLWPLCEPSRHTSFTVVAKEP